MIKPISHSKYSVKCQYSIYCVVIESKISVFEFHIAWRKVKTDMLWLVCSKGFIKSIIKIRRGISFVNLKKLETIKI